MNHDTECGASCDVEGCKSACDYLDIACKGDPHLCDAHIRSTLEKVLPEQNPMRYRSVLVIESQQDPRSWTLQNYYWAIENGEAVIDKGATKLSEIKQRTKYKVKQP